MSTASKTYALIEKHLPFPDDLTSLGDYVILEDGGDEFMPIGIHDSCEDAKLSVERIPTAKNGIILDKDMLINNVFYPGLTLVVDQKHQLREVKLEGGGLTVGAHRSDIAAAYPENFVPGTILLFDERG